MITFLVGIGQVKHTPSLIHLNQATATGYMPMNHVNSGLKTLLSHQMTISPTLKQAGTS